MHPFVHKLFTLKNMKFKNAILMAELQSRVRQERLRPDSLEQRYHFNFEKVKKLLGGSEENENYLPSGGEDDDSKDENYQVQAGVGKKRTRKRKARRGKRRKMDESYDGYD
jgi:hypothetical protein